MSAGGTDSNGAPTFPSSPFEAIDVLPGSIENVVIPRKTNVSADVIAPRTSVDLTRTMAQRWKLHHEVLFRDRVFTDDDWHVHHSWKRYLPEPVKTIRLLMVLLPPLSWIILVSLACGLYQQFRTSDMPDIDDLDLTFTYTICTFAISLVLVFKTNASYARWAEARLVWGTTYARMRNLVRKVIMYVPDMGAQERKMFVRWTIVLPYVMRSHLLSNVEGSLVLEPLLTECESVWLLAQPHMPIAAAGIVGALVAKQRMHPICLADVNTEISEYVGNVTACERISRQPIPMAYTRHTVRFLITFLSFLPVALWANLQWWTAFVAPLVAFLMMGIENIGNQIENPFIVLPMAAFCATMHANIVGLTDDWVAQNGQDTSSFVTKVLGRDAPAWQSEDTKLRSGERSPTTSMMADVCRGTVPDPSPDMTVGMSIFGGHADSQQHKTAHASADHEDGHLWRYF